METTIRIFLPVCSDMECDVFFNVVKNLIARARLDEHFLDNAFKVGMKGEKFIVEKSDVTDDWRLQKSKEQQTRQAKLLGYWASANFPVIGKKFFNLKWQSPQRELLEVNGESKKIKAEEIDAIIFKKLNLRLVELNVAQSTIQKLRLFIVDVPPNLILRNETAITPAIKSFEIGGEAAENCWKTMKFGLQDLQKISGPKRQPNRETQNANLNIVSQSIGAEFVRSAIQSAKRMHSDPDIAVKDVKVSQKNTGAEPAAKRIHHLDIDTSTDNCINTGAGGSDPIKDTLLVIRNEVGKWTEFVRSALATRDNESVNGLNMVIMNRKEEEIARLKEYSQGLLESNQSLAKDQTAVQKQRDRQCELINALQKGVDSTSKLQLQAERDLAASLGAVEAMKQEISVHATEIQKLRRDNRLLINKNRDEVLQFESEKLVLQQENDKLKTEVKVINTETAHTVNELQRALDDLHSASLSLNIENESVKADNLKLRDEWQDSNGINLRAVEAMKQEISVQAAEIQKLRDDIRLLINKNQDEVLQFGSENLVLQQENDKLKTEVKVINTETAHTVNELQRALDDLHSASLSLNIENESVKADNLKLRDEWQDSNGINLRAVEAMKQEISVQAAEIQKLRDDIRLLINKNQDEVLQFESENLVLQQENDKLKTEVKVINTETAHTVNELQRALDDLHSASLSLNIENESVKADNIKLRDEWQDSNGINLRAVEAMKQEISVQAAEIQKLRDDIRLLINKNQEEVLQFESENLVLQQENDKLKTEVKVINTETAHTVKELQRALDDLHSASLSLNIENESVKADNLKLRDEWQDSNGINLRAFEAMKQEISVQAAEIQKLRDDNQLLRNKNRDELLQLKSENLGLQQENDKIKSELKVLNTETAHTVSELQRTLEELASGDNSRSDVKMQTGDNIIEVPSMSVEVVSAGSQIDPNVTGKCQKSGLTDEQNGADTDEFRQNAVTVPKEIDLKTIGSTDCAQNQKFVKDDDVVTTCRPILQKLKFGWMTFQPTKSAKFVPGFVHPPDSDGKQRAQKVTTNGYVTDKKNIFFEFFENVADEKKDKAGVSSLKKFNSKFRFSFV